MQDEEQSTANELKILTAEVNQLVAGLAREPGQAWASLPAVKDSRPGTKATQAADGSTTGSAWESLPQNTLGSTITARASDAATGSDGHWWSSLVSPVLGSVIDLLTQSSGSSDGDTTVLPPVALPESRSYNLGYTASQPELFGVERRADGLLRQSVPTEAAGSTQSVVVEVHAMDSQSFLDRRGDIADAVRLALLESHQLQDVISRGE
jgi:hypothetical protein